jgi:hypothetical protein
MSESYPISGKKKGDAQEGYFEPNRSSKSREK